MPGTPKPRKIDPRRSTAVRRKMNGNERDSRAQAAPLLTRSPENAVPSASPSSAPETAAAPEAKSPATAPAPARKVKKGHQSLTVEQTLQFSPGKGKPVVSAEIRLTTAQRGKRKSDGLSEAAYLLRLEVLSASEAVKVEGLRLGPWQLQDLQLEPGSLHVAPPVWAGFQPSLGTARGRIFLGDALRNRLLDLPLETEAVIPGPEAMAG